jgi:carbon monoxide dehydrogenase subunit G
MEFSGTVEIAASRQAVWDFLADFDGLAACGPGVESIERIDERHARVTAKLGVGFIVSRFVIDLERESMEAPDRATLTGRGEAPGTQVEGRAEMRLSGPPDGPTTLDWRADVDIFGSLAGIGGRLIESTAGRLIDQAFDCVRARLADQPAA